MHCTVGELVDRARRLIVAGDRRLLGICGPPGAGKSTLASALLDAVSPDAVVVPMDGFHLSNEVLAQLGISDRKGSPDSFDAAGFRALLGRLRAADEPVVYAPEFRREIEEAISGAIPVHRETPLVIVEGNYLLLDHGPWHGIRDLLDEVWYLDLPQAERTQRLLLRHQRHGCHPAVAEHWVSHNDDLNAAVVARTRPRADLVVRLDDEPAGA